MKLVMVKERALRTAARMRTGRYITERGDPAASMMASSESLFIVVKIWVMPMTSAKGSTTGMSVGRIIVASAMKEPIDWPVSVTRLILWRTWMVQMMASTGSSATRNICVVRRRI
ncbi:hypothetical protein D3C71_1327590 [compost metagenome]